MISSPASSPTRSAKAGQSGTLAIDGRPIGPKHPPYIIAELSGNHNGDLGRAFAILDAVKETGADAAKLQTYRPDTITINHRTPAFRITGGLWDGRYLWDLYEEAHTPWEWHEPLFTHARDIGLTLFSAPFDPTAADLLQSLNAPAYKVASPEIVDTPLIAKMAETGKPLIISTGMASREDIAAAVAAARKAGARDLILLHCTSAYPTPPNQANLTTLPDLAKQFGVTTGLSDHTLGTLVATLAVSLGACVIEKHVTLKRADGGVDSAFSLEPDELARLVQDTRTAHSALGMPTYRPTDAEVESLRFRRSLYVVQPIRSGEPFNNDNIRSIRPSNGLPPSLLDQVIGKVASRDLAFGEPLDVSMVKGGLA